MRRIAFVGVVLAFLAAVAPAAVQSAGGGDDPPPRMEVEELSPETQAMIDRLAKHLLKRPDLLRHVVAHLSERWPGLLPGIGDSPNPKPTPKPDPDPDAEPRVDVCHVTDGEFELTSVPESEVQAHLDHGDVLPGDPVPDTAARRYDPDCQERFSILGLRVDGCVSAADLTAVCDPEFDGDPPPSAGLFSEPGVTWVAVDDSATEFSSPDGIMADFVGDFGLADVDGNVQQSAGSLTLTVPAGQPALRFYFANPDWVGGPWVDAGDSLGVTGQGDVGPNAFFIETASTVGAEGPQAVTFQIVAQEDDSLVPEIFE